MIPIPNPRNFSLYSVLIPFRPHEQTNWLRRLWFVCCFFNASLMGVAGLSAAQHSWWPPPTLALMRPIPVNSSPTSQFASEIHICQDRQQGRVFTDATAQLEDCAVLPLEGLSQMGKGYHSAPTEGNVPSNLSPTSSATESFTDQEVLTIDDLPPEIQQAMEEGRLPPDFLEHIPPIRIPTPELSPMADLPLKIQQALKDGRVPQTFTQGSPPASPPDPTFPPSSAPSAPKGSHAPGNKERKGHW